MGSNGACEEPMERKDFAKIYGFDPLFEPLSHFTNKTYPYIILRKTCGIVVRGKDFTFGISFSKHKNITSLANDIVRTARKRYKIIDVYSNETLYDRAST